MADRTHESLRSAVRGVVEEWVIQVPPRRVPRWPRVELPRRSFAVPVSGTRWFAVPVSGTRSFAVPAHNEEALLGRLLSRLLESAGPDEFDIVVVANGCTDGTEAVAAGFAPRVRVVSTGIPSKRAALRLGDEAARGFPRLYVDGDVELGTADARRLCAAVAAPGVLAAAPERAFDMAGRRWPVRWYYEVWTRLPEVRAGLFGRGVLAVSEAGHQRIAALPPVMADDLAVSLAFAPAER